MTYEQMIEMALNKGFAKAAIVDTADIVFDLDFVKYCEENVCKNYNANYCCPPLCGKPQSMKDRVMKHKKALVLESQRNISDFSDYTPIKEAKLFHNNAQLEMMEQFKKDGHNGFMVGASQCMLCSPCLAVEGKPCIHPDIAWSCMSAYCINVKDLATKCGMNYDFVPGRLSLYSMFVFD